MLRQRVAHVSGGDAVFAQPVRLERKQAQHEISRRFQARQLARAPGPERGADEVHGFHAGGFQARFQREVEIRRVDADERVGPLRQQPRAQAAAQAQKRGQARQHFQIAAHREFFHGPPGVKALLGHALAANARRAQAGPGSAQGRQQMRAQ